MLDGRGTRVAACSSPNINARVNPKGSVAPAASNTYSKERITLEPCRACSTPVFEHPPIVLNR